MKIILRNIGKKFNRRWIFRDIDFEFDPQHRYAILGGNGSGKSTLLQIISGHHSPSKGDLTYFREGKKISVENVFRYISMAAPYLDLPEELSFREILEFHSRFKKPILSIKEILEITNLKKDADKVLSYYSSGMRQRAKLALSLFFESELVFHDEPTSHLDAKGQDWYQEMIKGYIADRLLIIASNDPQEYILCDTHLNIEEFKEKR